MGQTNDDAIPGTTWQHTHEPVSSKHFFSLRRSHLSTCGAVCNDNGILRRITGIGAVVPTEVRPSRGIVAETAAKSNSALQEYGSVQVVVSLPEINLVRPEGEVGSKVGQGTVIMR